MKTQSVEKTVQELVGHIIAESTEEKRQFERLFKSLDRCDLTLDQNQLRKGRLSIEKADMFFEEKIPKKCFESIREIAGRQILASRKPSFKMYARDTPVQELLLEGSQAEWSIGSKVGHTIGPLKNKDGRMLWFDFYPIAKLAAIYIKGVQNPILLCNVRKDPNPSRLQRYTVVGQTVWLNAHYLTSTAPLGQYVGLQVKNGLITINKKPTILGDKLIIPADAKCGVELKLQQAEQMQPGTGKAGADARKIQLGLPEDFSFQFSGQGLKVTNVGNSSWEIYGQKINFSWNARNKPAYNSVLKRIIFPFKPAARALKIRKVLSPFNIVDGEAQIISSGWSLPLATIDIDQPTETSGNGEVMLQVDKGLREAWTNLEAGTYFLNNPVILAGPSQFVIADITVGNPQALYSLELWQDEQNINGTSVDLTFGSPALFLYVCNAKGYEVVATFCDGNFKVDRPVKVDGEPPVIKTKGSFLVIAVSEDERHIAVYDENLLFDASQDIDTTDVFQSMAFALTNGLFTTTQANGCLLFGSLTKDFKIVENGALFLTFGLIGYLPTLPDPYAANLGLLENQYKGHKVTDKISIPTLSCWFVSRVGWEAAIDEETRNDVDVSFHFAPLSSQFSGVSVQPENEDQIDPDTGPTVDPGKLESVYRRQLNPDLDGKDITANNEISDLISTHNILSRSKATSSVEKSVTPNSVMRSQVINDRPAPVFEDQWDKVTEPLRRSIFSLLDVSSAADLQGISFDHTANRKGFITTHVPAEDITKESFPLQVQGMKVVSKATNVKSFTVPQISWEPLLNLSYGPLPLDPPVGPNYFPDDGGPTQIINNGGETVALAPLPLTKYLVDNLQLLASDFEAKTLMTLPFGMKALAVLKNEYVYTDEDGQSWKRRGTSVRFNSEEFDNEIKGGLQLQIDGGEAVIKEQSDMFIGSCVQLTNVLDPLGNLAGNTLGETVSEIFNNEFLLKPSPQLIRQRGVPLTRIDLSGYGATAFSNWLNPAAAFAETSQAKFDVLVGRCGHEIIQVKSIVYPWGIKVVRTITLFRVGSGYVYRYDSGWKAESDGVYDFRYFTTANPTSGKTKRESPFSIHPGIVQGLYNVSNITETNEITAFEGVMKSTHVINDAGFYVTNPDVNDDLSYKLQPVYFDADILIDGLTSGFKTKNIDGRLRRVTPSKKIIGFVQSAPRGIPINNAALKSLIVRQLGAISGPVDCEVDMASSGQKMRLNRFDFSNSFDQSGNDIFAVAGRGNVLLPGEGSWAMVIHDRGTGEISPVSSDKGAAVIREGLVVDKDSSGNDHQSKLEIKPKPDDVLLRIAEPAELLRAPVPETQNYGFLQSTDTQKALVLTPAFEKGESYLCSKTQPLFADSFRIVNSKAVFPNVGNADSDIGNAISLQENNNEFAEATMLDQGKKTYQILDVRDSSENPLEVGYKLLKEVVDFELPTEFELIDLGDGIFRIYIEYKQGEGSGEKKGLLDFDIDSTADIENRWRSHMSNLGLVVDLAGIDRLMTIRGNWKSNKGAAASYPEPEIEFAKELQPVIDILEILQQLQGGNYAGALANGLKLAMSNKAGSWEYKFEASKEIPVLRFPVPDEVYNNPNTPFKLEAGMTLGAYFNSALKITTDANELLPSAGGFLGFYGRLSVMCVSLSVGTIYALGQVNLDIAADTKVGPSLRMKFGFGAQLVIGLPVAGHVSVLFVVGVEIFASSGLVEVSAFMLFEGHAEILGGIVSITIRIEAKGTVSRQLTDGKERTDLTSQVTFGLDISIFLVINISFEESWSEQRQIA